MSSLSLSQFEATCQEQGVALHLEITDPTTVLWACHTPSSMLSAVAKAAMIARQMKFKKQPPAIGELQVTEEISHDPVALALTHIIQDAARPNTDQTVYHAPRESQHDIEACRVAERKFATTVRTLDNPADHDEKLGGQIIVDKANKPLLLRKRHGESSALSLQPMIIRGIRYPAGSLMRLDLVTDKTNSNDGLLAPARSQAEVTVLSEDKVEAVAFRRLSAFCLAVSDRHIFATHGNLRRPSSVESDQYVQDTPFEEVLATIKQTADSITANQ